MGAEILPLVATLLVIITSTGLLLSFYWRNSIFILSLQYVGVFVLVTIYWPVEMAVIKLLTGWVAGAILGFVLSSDAYREAESRGEIIWEEGSWPSGRLFRLFATGMVLMITWTMSIRLEDWVPGMSSLYLFAGLSLMGMGLLHLGITAHPFRVVLGLFTVLSGFEIVYAAVERSALVAGLLTAVNIGLSLIGAYLLLVMLREVKT